MHDGACTSRAHHVSQLNHHPPPDLIPRAMAIKAGESRCDKHRAIKRKKTDQDDGMIRAFHQGTGHACKHPARQAGQRPLALVPVSGQPDRQHLACDMISQGKYPIDKVTSMRTKARESSGLERGIHVVPGNVHIQQHMTKVVVESPCYQLSRWDSTNGHACAAGTNQLDAGCANAARAKEQVVRRICVSPKRADSPQVRDV